MDPRGQVLNVPEFRFKGKYFVWRESWSEEHIPPPYCNGQCTAMTSSAAGMIYQQAKVTPRNSMRLEDAFFAGILRSKANVDDIDGTGSTGFCKHLGQGSPNSERPRSRTA